MKEEDKEMLIDDVIHDLEALDFNSPEARKVVAEALEKAITQPNNKSECCGAEVATAYKNPTISTEIG